MRKCGRWSVTSSGWKGCTQSDEAGENPAARQCCPHYGGAAKLLGSPFGANTSLFGAATCSEQFRVWTVWIAVAETERMVPKWFHEHHRQEYSGLDLSGDEARGEKEEAESQCRDHPGARNGGRRSGAATAIE